MALDPNSFLLQMSPVGQLDLTRGMQISVQRQQIQQAKQRLEEERRANKENERLRELAEKGAMTRAQMEMDAQNQRHAQLALQKQEDDKRAALAKFSELTAGRDYEGAEAYIPYLEMLGAGVDVTRSPAGFPEYRIHENAAEDAKLEEQLQGAAWQRAERPLYEGVYDDAVRTAELGSEQLDETGMYGRMPEPPPPAPEEPGLPTWDTSPKTGHVLDTQVMQNQTLQRLDPTLNALVEMYPQEFQGYARSAADAARRSGLNVEESAGMFREQLGLPVQLAAAQTEAEAKKLEKEELTEVQKSGLRNTGRQAMRQNYKDQGVDAAISTLDLADRVVAALTSDNPAIQTQAGQLLVQLGQVKGVPSDKELGLALGDEKLSAFDKAGAFLETTIRGGFGLKQRDGLIRWAKMQKEKERNRLYEWLEGQERAMGENPSEYERAGMQEVLNTLPRSALSGYAEWRANRRKSGRQARGEPEEADPGSTDPEDIEDELVIQATEYGFDPDAVRPLMRTESGNDPGQKNKMGSSANGLFQFTDETAKDMGLKDAAAYAALPPDKQIELGMKRFQQLGLDENSTADDFAMANAAPGYIGAKPNTVIEQYRSTTDYGKEVRAKNPGWIPADGGEITNTSILDFYRRHRGEGAPAPSAAPAKAAADTQKKTWVPKNDVERDVYRKLYGKDPD